MKTTRETFEKEGFVVLENLYSRAQMDDIYQKIRGDIKKCASELNCGVEHYLGNVSRWVHPSPVTKSIGELAETSLKEIACHFMGEEVKLSKFNIISKSRYACDPVPCHQDIAYSKHDPYEFSLWLSLQDITLREGALEFLPGSHLKEIAPAIDFWEPNFIDQICLSEDWEKNHVVLPIQAGDAVVFDSRIWHRSGRNESGRNRFGIATRWSRLNYQPFCHIPEKIPATFGMWTCGPLTESILQYGLQFCFDLNSTGNLVGDIGLWQEKLKKGKKYPFLVDIPQAKKALDNLLILHQGSQLHNGGDAQGIVYPNLWHYLLEPLSQWLERRKDRPKKEEN